MNGRRSARQLPLNLAHRAAMTRADYLIGDANRAAVALIDGWPAWPDRTVLLSGPAGSGKTHLVEIWRHTNSAVVVAGNALGNIEHSPRRLPWRSRTCMPAHSTRRGCST